MSSAPRAQTREQEGGHSFQTILSPEKNSPSVIAGPIGKLLPLAHAQTGHRSRGALVIHVLHAASGHLPLRHEGLTASRHCGVAHNRQNEALSKAQGPKHPVLITSVILNVADINMNESTSGQDGVSAPLAPSAHLARAPRLNVGGNPEDRLWLPGLCHITQQRDFKMYLMSLVS